MYQRSFFFHPPFLISPLSLETCNPSRLLDTTHYEEIPDSIMIRWNKGDWKHIINIKPWKPFTYRNCVLNTECVLIGIIVTISTSVCSGCNFPHSNVGTNSHHRKTYLLVFDSRSEFYKKM